ncbi:MAG: KpsF/GutQ family sugar-phosphate isomerase [Hyphomicrobiales bacterium]|jgi:arabinose-5-phosphate isomerase|nr:KpsF/GutQ family sugar-phosphate isomerase [Alphaproteobacteria bacterium]MDG1524212.1 KpsF/GutQ family sugar-phosphate isomerase [Hyphomicrobiales bacterium]MDG2413444.1 KpsF/GutQ family sugar-phosphate isomerase [Hyphomicrobiales bacterium]|tara:strand:+ start:4323 stop:5273 length:951 start_codon:yes stop_codon:yes gene_type:complete
MKIIESAQKALSDEIEGLSLLKEFFNSDFEKAVDAIFNSKGKVVVTGVGKSGHIGRKISATLSSTGTPSYFIHPTEASHGDMGMIEEKDIILAISWSGETTELGNIVKYALENKIKLIGLSSNKESHLAKSSNIALNIPMVEEACPNGLAPTTSTTMQLVIGDAIAISLLNIRDFNKDNFRSLHPGGQLGAALAVVKDVMHSGESLPTIDIGSPMSEALIKISEKGFGCIGVISNNSLEGIITDGDLRRHMGPEILNNKVESIMTKRPQMVSSKLLVSDALKLINNLGIQGLFVTDDGKTPIGFVNFHDLIRVIKG